MYPGINCTPGTIVPGNGVPGRYLQYRSRCMLDFINFINKNDMKMHMHTGTGTCMGRRLGTIVPAPGYPVQCTRGTGYPGVQCTPAFFVNIFFVINNNKFRIQYKVAHFYNCV